MLEARIIPEFKSELVLSKIVFNEDDKCWEWNGYITHHGYGVYGKMGYMAHRVVYEVFVERLRSEESLDHLCKNTSCVNPKHMEVTSLRENVLRSSNPYATNARKKQCVRGHEFTTENTYVHPKRSTRHCKTCAKLAQTRFKERQL